MSSLSTTDLHDLLATHYRDRDDLTLELLGGADPVINLTLKEHGDMQVQIAASGAQILVSTVLVDAEDVRDRAGFNDACMRINPMNPLSNLGLTTVDGRDLYIVFGELSSSSSFEAIDEEIEMLATNTLDAARSLNSFFA